MQNVIKIPEELARELDLLAQANHKRPEMAQGGAAYVEKIRSEPDERFENTIRGNKAR